MTISENVGVKHLQVNQIEPCRITQKILLHMEILGDSLWDNNLPKARPPMKMKIGTNVGHTSMRQKTIRTSKN